jgi:enediyne biosynthesis protein E4
MPSPLSQGGAIFVDVAESAGLKYRWQIPGKRPLNILQTIGNGCAFLDYDSDGNLEILLVGPKLALYKGDGRGHFTDVTAATGLDRLAGHFLGCAVGDYDNDGYEDVYVSAYRGGVLLHNQDGKRFEDVTRRAGIAQQPWGTSCTFTDLDADGKLDLYICGYAKFGPQTQPQLCEYSGQMSACGPRFYMPERGALYHNEGSGRFRDITGSSGMLTVSGKGLGVAAADFDGAGRPGLAIANDEMPGDLMARLGSKFQNIGAKSGTAYDNSGNIHGGMGVDWGDYDNDGKLDLVVATFQHEAKCLYHNDGGGMFTESSANVGLADKTIPNVAFGVKFLDYDNDGFLDLVFANGHVQDNIASIDKTTTYRQPIQLFHNHGGEAYEEVGGQAGEPFRRNIVGRGLAVGDYDNDGRVDILAVDSEGAPLLLHNTTASGGHWLSVKLVGKKSNRNGYGAMVTVETAGSKRSRLCQTDGSYLSASDRRVHFGLGKTTRVTVRVRWPSGRTDVHKGLRADHVVTIREG